MASYWLPWTMTSWRVRTPLFSSYLALHHSFLEEAYPHSPSDISPRPCYHPSVRCYHYPLPAIVGALFTNERRFAVAATHADDLGVTSKLHRLRILKLAEG